MNKQCIISVIIPNYNGARFLKGCLDSLLAQRFKDFEVIVVDNGSRDESKRIVEEHPIKPVWLGFETNKGFCCAVNFGIKKSSGELIALLNNDAVADPRWLLEGFETANKRPEIDFFASLVLSLKERDIVESAGIAYSSFSRPWSLFEGNRASGNIISLEVFGASGAGAFFRRSFFEEIGFFDEDYFAYFEDVDLCFRAILAGKRGVLVPSAVVYHLGGGTELKDKRGNNQRESSHRVFLQARNRWYLIYDNLPLSLIILWSWRIFLGMSRGFFYHFFLSGRWVNFLAGFFKGAFSFPWRLKKRKKVFSMRKIDFFELKDWIKKGAQEL